MIPTNSSGHLQLARPQLALVVAARGAARRSPPRLRGGWA